jgi:hypothetical protein
MGLFWRCFPGYLFFLLQAQTVLLRGRVESMEGEPLPHALVRLPESGFQILTRADGTFQLNLPEGRTPLEIRYLGFSPHQETLSIQLPGPIEYTFRLRRQDIRLPSVIITEGQTNPAEILIRRAIERKNTNRTCLPAYRSEIYSLFTARLPEGLPPLLNKLLKKQGDSLPPGGIIYMSEALSEVDFQPPNKYKETIRYSRVVGTRRYGFTGLWLLQGFDPYQDRLNIPEITKSPLVLPLANDALPYYRYQIIGEVWDKEGFLYQIAFEPKNPQIGIRGYLVLVDETYALRGMEGWITQEQGTPYVDTIHLRMQYAPVGPCWAPAEIQLKAKLKAEFVGLSIILTAEGHFLYRRYALLQEQKLKRISPSRPTSSLAPAAAPDTFPKGFRIDTIVVKRLDFSERLRILEGAEKPENTFWDSLRKVPLDTFQQLYMEQADSLLRGSDTLDKPSRVRRGLAFGGGGLRYAWGRRKGEQRWESGLTVLWPGYTSLEGWVFRGEGTFQHQGRAALWEGAIRVRYGSGWRRALPEAGLTYRKSRFPPFRAELRGGWEAREGPDLVQVPLLWNTLFYLLRREAPLQVYDRFYVCARGSFRWHRCWHSAIEVTYDRRPSTPTRESYYPAYRLSFFTEWTPGTQLYRTPRSTILMPPEGPFQITIQTGHEIARLPNLYLWTGYLGIQPRLSISPWGKWHWSHGLHLQSNGAPWADRLFPNAQPLPLHQRYTDLFFWPLYRPAGRLSYQTQAQWNLERAILRHLPLLRKTNWQEHLSFRALYTEGDWHAEGSFWLTEIALGIGHWRLPTSLSLGMHYGLLGAHAGLWRITFALGTPAFPSLTQKRFTQ